MALAAGGGNVGMVHGRFDIVGRQNLVRPAVTIHAPGAWRPTGLVRLRMMAASVSFLRVGMALRASDLCRRSLVRRFLHVRVTIDTGEHLAVDGMFQLVCIDIEAGLLAVGLSHQTGVGVALKAILILGLVPGICGAAAKEQGNRNGLRTESSCCFHWF